MALIFERGPQTDETARYELQPGGKRVPINVTFQRNSSFVYHKKKNTWEEKECKLCLVYYENQKKQVAG